MDNPDAKPLPEGAPVLLPARPWTPAEHANLRSLARTVFPRSPSRPASAANLDVPLTVRFPQDAEPMDAAGPARTVAGLERANDEARAELSQLRERVRRLSDAVADQAKLVAGLQARLAVPAGTRAAAPGRGEALGGPDWTPPMGLLPRGMR